MAEKYLIVVDMQKDFVDGALGTEEAKAIVEAVLAKVRSFEGTVIFTKDTHFEEYLCTQEGKMLPVKHCIKGTQGWELIEELAVIQADRNCKIYEKNTFGSVELAEALLKIHKEQGIESVELIGLCTDICVVSNALLIKAYLPEIPVCIDSSCCAGVTMHKHAAALETMRSCQILVK